MYILLNVPCDNMLSYQTKDYYCFVAEFWHIVDVNDTVMHLDPEISPHANLNVSIPKHCASI